MSDLEQAIRERAYQLWMEGGCPDGQGDTHWLAAQREILSTSLGEMGQATGASSATSAKPRKARAPRSKKRAA